LWYHTDFIREHLEPHVHHRTAEGAGVVLIKRGQTFHVNEGDRVLLNWACHVGECFPVSERGRKYLRSSKAQVPDEHSIEARRSALRSINFDGSTVRLFLTGNSSVEVEDSFHFGLHLGRDVEVMTGFGSVVMRRRSREARRFVVLGIWWRSLKASSRADAPMCESRSSRLMLIDAWRNSNSVPRMNSRRPRR